jgi:hypothetical protein
MPGSGREGLIPMIPCSDHHKYHVCSADDTVGAAYGPRLGMATIPAGKDCRSCRSMFSPGLRRAFGFEYMMRHGRLLVGYVLAIWRWICGAQGWDRSIGTMALAMLIGNVLIYIWLCCAGVTLAVLILPVINTFILVISAGTVLGFNQRSGSLSVGTSQHAHQ